MNAKDKAKWAAAEGALSFVKDGMVVGLGTGSTAEKFVTLLAEKVKKENLSLLCVPTSESTAALAESLGLILDKSYPDFGHIDVTVDGADEIDPQGNLIKGGGGALLREKYVAMASEHMVVIADNAKNVEYLGRTFKLPVEIVSFAWSNTLERVKALGATGDFRQKDGKFFVTDQGNYIADCTFGDILDPLKLHKELKAISGVVETGIFPKIASFIVIGYEDGSFKHSKVK